jgi:hypothetical protein
MKIKSVTNDYGIVDAKDIKLLVEAYGLDTEKIEDSINKKFDLSQTFHILTDVGNITIDLDYKMTKMKIKAPLRVREAIAEEE